MSAVEKVECDRCGLKVRVLTDDILAEHGWTRHGVKTRCDSSGKKYSRHMGSFRVTQRGSDGIATEWVCECRCGRLWLGPDHKAIERPWAEHTQDVKETAA